MGVGFGLVGFGGLALAVGARCYETVRVSREGPVGIPMKASQTLIVLYPRTTDLGDLEAANYASSTRDHEAANYPDLPVDGIKASH